MVEKIVIKILARKWSVFRELNFSFLFTYSLWGFVILYLEFSGLGPWALSNGTSLICLCNVLSWEKKCAYMGCTLIVLKLTLN